jgi:hypothetical protein
VTAPADVLLALFARNERLRDLVMRVSESASVGDISSRDLLDLVQSAREVNGTVRIIEEYVRPEGQHRNPSPCP